MHEKQKDYLAFLMDSVWIYTSQGTGESQPLLSSPTNHPFMILSPKIQGSQCIAFQAFSSSFRCAGNRSLVWCPHTWEGWKPRDHPRTQCREIRNGQVIELGRKNTTPIPRERIGRN